MQLADFQPLDTTGTFYQTLLSLSVYQTENHREAVMTASGTEPAEDFHDRVADVYLGRLALSLNEHDRAIRARFPREVIRETLHRVIEYHFVPKEEVASHDNRLLSGKPERSTIQLELMELCPHYFDLKGDTTRGTFYQAVWSMDVWRTGLIGNADAARLSRPYLRLTGTQPAEGFLDRLAEAYWVLLLASSDPHDQAMREKYTLAEIKTRFAQVLTYQHDPDVRTIWGQSAEAEPEARPTKSIWQAIWG